MKKGGFTLIEVMVVILIMGIVAGLTLPALRKSIPNSNLDSSAKVLVTDLRLARQKAVTINHNFLFIYEQNRYEIVDDENENGVKDNNERFKEVRFPRYVSADINHADHLPLTVIFSGAGFATDPATGNPINNDNNLIRLINTRGLTKDIELFYSGIPVLY